MKDSNKVGSLPLSLIPFLPSPLYMLLFLPPDELYMVTVPSLLGVVQALQGCGVSRRKTFWTMCHPYQDPWKKEDGKVEKMCEGVLDEKHNMALFDVVRMGI